MTRLTRATLAQVPAGIARPAYEPAAVTTGIVHFGPGAFHRAHQAAYIDRLLADDPRWGIAAVSVRSGGPVKALAPQDGLYTIAVLDEEPSFQVIGAHSRLVGPDDAGALATLLADPAVRIVTSTVTEKGYCLAGDGTLDMAHPDIAHDLADRARPVSLVGWLTQGFAARRDAGVAPFVAITCDNMAHNGKKLAAAVHAYARRLDPALADWIAGEARFPETMVDSITPATDDAVRDKVSAALGMRDEAPVQREAFLQWVIEDILPGGMPDFAGAGVTLSGDVAAHERAKLRILNGAHSSLAYIGLVLGLESVGDAVGDAALGGFAERLIRRDIIPSLGTDSGIDLEGYADAILRRFRNPAIRHLLSQIAWDGTQKLPYRLIDTILDARANGRPLERLAIPIAAWMAFVRRQARNGVAIVDPLADRLAAIGTGAVDDAALVDALLALDAVFPASLRGDAGFRQAVLRALDATARGGDALRASLGE